MVEWARAHFRNNTDSGSDRMVNWALVGGRHCWYCVRRVLRRVRVPALVYAPSAQTVSGTLGHILSPQWAPLAASSVYEPQLQCGFAARGLIPRHASSTLKSALRASRRSVASECPAAHYPVSRRANACHLKVLRKHPDEQSGCFL